MDITKKQLFWAGGILLGVSLLAFVTPKIIKAIKGNRNGDKPKDEPDSGGSGNGGNSPKPEPIKDTKIKIGDSLYPIGQTTNIRTDPYINNAEDWYDKIDNLIKKDATGFLGTVISSQKGKEDGLTWFKIKFPMPIHATIKTYSEGWVREDVVKKG